jgi:antirestriction protein ArdC
MSHASARSARAGVYSRITDGIVAAIEHGARDWHMPWHHDGGSPRNVASDRPYRGINILALWVAATRSGYTGGTWGTYRQWAERGCQVRRGETATTVVFWKTIDGRTTAGDDADRLDHDEGGGARPRFLARGYYVFNEAQVDGTAPRELPRLPESERIAHADAFFAALKIPIVFEGSEACYRPYIDTVFMPPFERFVDAASFYSTLGHECGHNAEFRIMPRRSGINRHERAHPARHVGIIRGLPGRRAACRQGGSGWVAPSRGGFVPSPSPSAGCRRGCTSAWSRPIHDRARAR